MVRLRVAGRSPLTKQHKITDFFAPCRSAVSSSSSISTPDRVSSTPSWEIELKTLESKRRMYGEEVVGRRIKIYRGLDMCWYEGYVKSFNKFSGEHLIQYDDNEVETFDLKTEKFEWVEETVTNFRRLKRKEEVVVEKKEEHLEEESEGESIVDLSSW